MAENGSSRKTTTSPSAAATTNLGSPLVNQSNGHDSQCNGVSDKHSDDGEMINGGGEDNGEVQDIPLDFSVKRKSIESISESLTDESRSSPSPHRAYDNLQETYGENYKFNDASSSSSEKSERIGEPKTAIPGVTPSHSALASMGIFPGMPPGFAQNGNMLGSFSAVAAFVDQQRAQGNKNTRPFKAYPKEALTLPVGYYGLPGYLPLPSLDGAAIHGLNMNSDEIMNIYKQQLQVLKERDKHHVYLAKSNSGSPDLANPSRTSSNGSSTGSGMTTTPSTPTHTPTSSPMKMRSIPTLTGGVTTPHVSSTSAHMSHGSRKRPRTLPDEQKDQAYWERRRKNNDAAKRSRDARRAKEDEIAIRAALLEQENLKLRVEVAALKSETARLRCMLYNS